MYFYSYKIFTAEAGVRLWLSLNFTKRGLIAEQLYCVALDSAGVFSTACTEDSLITDFDRDRNPATTSLYPPTLISLKSGGGGQTSIVLCQYWSIFV